MQRLKDYFTLNKEVQNEYQDLELEFDAPLPVDLNGTLFRNGNGRFVHQGVRYDHLFDGDGMLTKFTFREGKAFYRNRYVQTREFQEEEAAGKMLYRSFGTNLPGGFWANALKTHFKNASNTSVIWHGGKLLSLWEGGWPHEIDPYTLETKGRFHYSGYLKNSFSKVDAKIFPELAFSAHPKIHPDTGDLHNFGVVPGLSSRLVQYQIDADGQSLPIWAKKLPAVSFTHDFILTASGKRIFFFTPVNFGLAAMFLGFKPPVASIQVRQDEPIEIMVFDPDEDQEYSFETDFGFIFHFTNGYERSDGQIVVDGFLMPDFPDAEVNKQLFEGDDSATPAGILYRYLLNLKTGEVQRERRSPYPGELPTFHPSLTGKKYRYTWCLGLPEGADYKMLDGIQKIDVEQGTAHLKSMHPHLPGEPLFIPKSKAQKEDEGYLAVLIFNALEKTTWLYILDAETLSEITKARLPHNIPLGFHGKFVDRLFIE
ncbi:MAG TPA: carotenoid oxygenase family protein [Saprospiraceae bacterium]|nr:carotenoid oxygenase family protein [Saprospiraceae bacterium]